jgi:aspartyl-tRNA(Asn)/glutamyl-tRNA(Gln) amidotransferase subunit C
MSISKDEVRKVARLAALALTEEETARLGKNLEDILSYVEKLRELPLDEEPPFESVTGDATPLREDEIRPSLPKDEALSNAPSREEGWFKVPRVVEGG